MSGSYDQAKTLTRTATFTVAASDVTILCNDRQHKFYSIQVKGTGAAATAWDVRVEGSNDGTNFTQIVAHATGDGDGALKNSGATPFPAGFVRIRLNSVTLGSATAVVAYLIAVG